MQSDLVLGIDGGGTKTQAWISTREGARTGKALGQGRAGGSNPQTIGAAAAIKNVERAVQAAFQDAALDRGPVASACLCLAGADRPRDRMAFQSWAERVELAERVTITNDATALLYAASEWGVGVALIAGTGSFAFGRNSANRTTRCGGWGWLFGDEGSGYMIAREGLRAAARAADGRGPSSLLLERFLDELQLATPIDLISRLYSDDIDRAAIARLAEVVFDCDQKADEVAGQILRSAVIELADLVEAVAKDLFSDEPSFPLALAGGVLLNQARIRDQLGSELSSRRIPRHEITTVQQPVAGAVVLAAQ